MSSYNRFFKNVGLYFLGNFATKILQFLFIPIYSIYVDVKDYGEKTAFTIEEVMGASLLFAISVAALGNITVFGFNIKNIICILIVLVLGWKNGILVGSTGGITIGVVLGIIGKGDPMLIAAFALSRNDSRNFK